MTTIIDWNKAPHDATHVGFDGNSLCWYKDITKSSYRYITELGRQLSPFCWDMRDGDPKNTPLIARAANPEIDLKTLNVTFGELDLETQLRLAKHVLQSGKVARFINGEWINYGDKLHFSYNIKYRAAWAERDTIEASIKIKESELQELYSDLSKLEDWQNET